MVKVPSATFSSWVFSVNMRTDSNPKRYHQTQALMGATRPAPIRTCVFSDFVNASPSRRNSLIFNTRHSMLQKVMKSGNSQIQLWKERRTPCKALLTSSLFAPLYSAYWKSTSYPIKLGDAGWRKQRSEPCFALLRVVRPCTAYREDIST